MEEHSYADDVAVQKGESIADGQRLGEEKVRVETISLANSLPHPGTGRKHPAWCIPPELQCIPYQNYSAFPTRTHPCSRPKWHVVLSVSAGGTRKSCWRGGEPPPQLQMLAFLFSFFMEFSIMVVLI